VKGSSKTVGGEMLGGKDDKLFFGGTPQSGLQHLLDEKTTLLRMSVKTAVALSGNKKIKSHKDD